MTERCKRCLYLGFTPAGLARETCFCNWCLSMGSRDNQLRKEKGMKFAPEDLQP